MNIFQQVHEMQYTATKFDNTAISRIQRSIYFDVNNFKVFTNNEFTLLMLKYNWIKTYPFNDKKFQTFMMNYVQTKLKIRQKNETKPITNR
tara:strand:+ start:16027 stop:16299 length:273 start_codon:yes stop_codon:yes gene_type:complete